MTQGSHDVAHRVLLVEDDQATARLIANELQEQAYEVAFAAAAPAAIEAFLTGQYDVAIVDRMLPGGNGLNVIRQVRAAGVATPILVLTALDRIEDRVAGLDAGADDYLAKPFAMTELIARLRALQRRGLPTGDHMIVCGGLVIDPVRREILYYGKAIFLQPRELKLLELLVRNLGRVVTRTMFLETVWGFNFDPRTNIVETHMSRLRSRLMQQGVPVAIETVRGAGYRISDPSVS